MAHRRRRGALALVFTGIGFAVLYRRRETAPRPANDGWVDLLPELVSGTSSERTERGALDVESQRRVRAQGPAVQA